MSISWQYSCKGVLLEPGASESVAQGKHGNTAPCLLQLHCFRSYIITVVYTNTTITSVSSRTQFLHVGSMKRSRPEHSRGLLNSWSTQGIPNTRRLQVSHFASCWASRIFSHQCQFECCVQSTDISTSPTTRFSFWSHGLQNHWFPLSLAWASLHHPENMEHNISTHWSRNKSHD